MPPEKNNHLSVIFGIVALIILSGIVYLYLEKTREVDEVLVSETATSSTTSLGSELYLKAGNPIDDKLPSQKTTANPIDDAYTNPFK